MQTAPIDLETLRLLLEAQPVALRTRFVACVIALALVAVVFDLVRRRKLREDFTPVWVTCSVAILALALSVDALAWVTDLLGAWTASSTVFFLGIVFLMAVALNYAVRLSAMSNQLQVLSQEIALLKAEQGAGEPGSCA